MNETILTAVAGLLGILLTQSYARNLSLREGLKNKKQKLYADFMAFMYPVFTNNAEADVETISQQLKTHMPKLLTFASNNVIKSTGDLLQHAYKVPSTEDEAYKEWNLQSMIYMGDLILAIRNDLGHKKFTEIMEWQDTVRLWVTDIDNYLPPNKRGNRAIHNGPEINAEQ